MAERTVVKNKLRDAKNPAIEIQNVVASVALRQRFDLGLVSTKLPNSSYRPEVFPGVIYKMKKPKASFLVFSSGKMVCTGATSEEKLKEAVDRIVDDLKRYTISIDGRPEITIQNIVASGDLLGAIDLEAAIGRLNRAIYEPDQFPGLIYRMEKPKVVMLLFASGKIVCTGAKRQRMVQDAVVELQRELVAKGLLHYE
jgi:transcription initiation factor TFIID TATA-box-binding protein